MKFSSLAIIFAIFVVGVCGAKSELPEYNAPDNLPIAEERPKPKTTTTTTQTPEPTKTSSTEETSTTEKPTAPTEKSTTSTEKPTTSTEKPPTTSSEKPTTSTEKSTTSTEKPPTTSSEKPATSTENPTTSTEKPAPIKPETHKWALHNGTYKCIIIQLATQLDFTYKMADNKLANESYVIPVNKTTIAGTCGNGTSEQKITVAWPTETGNGTKNNSFCFTFRLSDDDKKYQLHEIHYEIFAHDLANGTNDWLNFYHVNTSFSAPKHESFYCNRKQQLNLTATENSTQTVGTLFVSHVQLQAYRTDDKEQFSAPFDCDASADTSGIVPIVVGISLISLVVVVLIAYLVGRRRTAARGYVSM